MTSDANAARQELIDRICQEANKLPEKEAELFCKFARAFYRRIFVEDFKDRSVLDLYGAALSQWQLLKSRNGSPENIRVYNPQFDQHGWQSSHTIIEAVHENVPFLVDSLRAELNRRGYFCHLMIYLSQVQLVKSKNGEITSLLIDEEVDSKKSCDTVVYVEINRQVEEGVCEQIHAQLKAVFADVRACVEDWEALQQKAKSVIEELSTLAINVDDEQKEESIAFLQWLLKNNFTFLGYYRISIEHESSDTLFKMVEGTGLGVLKEKQQTISYRLTEMNESGQDELLKEYPLIIQGKTSTISTVHRPVFTDVISVKEFDQSGRVVGHHKFIGLYTSAAYNQRPHHIPITRLKVRDVLSKADVQTNTHEGKEIYNILETLPRDELIQASTDEIFETAMGILQLQERTRVRLFVRKDILGSFYACLVYVPRDKFNSHLRERISNILQNALNGYQTNFSTHFSDSMLARIYFVVRIKRGTKAVEENVKVLEEKIAQTSLTWEEELSNAISDQFGEEKADKYFKKYQNAFPASYVADFPARMAVFDIQHIEGLKNTQSIAMSFYRPLEEMNAMLRFKLFQPGSPIPLSDVVPMLENFGLEVKSECPYGIHTGKDRMVWINDFCMSHARGQDLNAESVRDIFQSAFYNVWAGNAESDGFNRLVLSAEMSWREIAVVRAYAKYLWQIGFTFSQNYLEKALFEHPNIARMLTSLFDARFNPDIGEKSDQLVEDIDKKFFEAVDSVKSLDQDRILRRYRDVILGTLRTNFYQPDADGQPKNYISFKINPKTIPDMPRPLPEYEIFVYSPRVEGVHLRTSNVARGGLRWSDRREDFRTEVLGLVKAQRVKNSVIVPMGAKGGFYPKCLPVSGTREEIMEEGISCYKTFIRGLLDITDNLVDSEVVPPKNVVRHDPDDYYLVVAADKGTATFSDIANSISEEYGFWLGDAFASGGSEGYDHKGMGITARGGWESVKRHFREINIDCQKEDFTVVGIGDMSGDVFGNGMLLSNHICLVGAFNHMHIFVDPNPNSQASFEERKRLFDVPRSQWTDYNAELISEGGGIFQRSAKSIPVSEQMKERFGITENTIEPNKLIIEMLKAPVDLLWNGGIGTYVCASTENNADVGDRANDQVRIKGIDLKAKIIGEGGNLGFTQLGRIEYALNGGRCNTDAIDNSAGVDCSDHEVNIKILLNELVRQGELTHKHRNQLLVEMTDEVGELCLSNNRFQTEALSVAEHYGPQNIEMHKRLIHVLELEANLDTSIEFIPDSDGLMERKKAEKGLVRPEVAVLMAYVKISLKQQILASKIPEDEFAFAYLESAFPQVLKERYEPMMRAHRLTREIVSTQLANAIVNEMGINFVQRLKDETGAHTCDIVRGYIIARSLFNVQALRESINSLDFEVAADVQSQMLYEVTRLTRRGTRWLIRHNRHLKNIKDTIEKFGPNVEILADLIPKVLKSTAKDSMNKVTQKFKDAGVPSELAVKIGTFSGLFSSLDIVEASLENQLPIERFAEVYYALGARLRLGWFREEIKNHPVASNWDALARAAFRDSLDTKQRDLSALVLQCAPSNVGDVEECINRWFEAHDLQVHRWENMIQDLKAAPKRDYTMYSVALRELMDLGGFSDIVS
jgi:glutamate dehydrogenase